MLSTKKGAKMIKPSAIFIRYQCKKSLSFESLQNFVLLKLRVGTLILEAVILMNE